MGAQDGGTMASWRDRLAATAQRAGLGQLLLLAVLLRLAAMTVATPVHPTRCSQYLETATPPGLRPGRGDW